MSTALLNFIPVKLVNPNPSWNFVFSYFFQWWKIRAKWVESWDFELRDVTWRHKLKQLIRIVSTSGRYQFLKVLGDLSHWWSSYRSFSEIQKCSCVEVFVELPNYLQGSLHHWPTCTQSYASQWLDLTRFRCI